MKHTEQREKMRAILAGSKCLSPASVYDPLSARVAEAVGYELGMLAGSRIVGDDDVIAGFAADGGAASLQDVLARLAVG